MESAGRSCVSTKDRTTDFSYRIGAGKFGEGWNPGFLSDDPSFALGPRSNDRLMGIISDMSTNAGNLGNLGPRCGTCGYDLRGSGRSANCPECGAALASNTIWPEDPSRVDPGSAFSRSGLDSLAMGAWTSAAPISGLMLAPLCAQIAMLLVTMCTILRIHGWRQFRRSPLRRFDEIGFERSMRIPTFVEPVAAFITLVVFGLVVAGPLPRVALLIALAGWSIAGVAGLLSPLIAGFRLGRRLDDSVMRFVGMVAIAASLIAGIFSLGLISLVSVGTVTATPLSSPLQITLVVVTIISLLSSVLAAHLTRVMITGIQAVFLDDHVEDRRRGPTRTRIGGAWIHFRRGRAANPVRSDPVNRDSIPLEPERPPKREFPRTPHDR